MSRYFIHKYELKPLQALNACAKGRARQGAWIRFQGDHGDWLFADCCPFPELGHPNLREQLQSLKQGSPLPLMQSCLRLAEWEDSWSRRHSITSQDILNLTHHRPFAHHSEILNGSQTHVSVKLKMGADLKVETRQWLTQASENPHWSWRLDFNNSLSFEVFEAWWSGLPADLKGRVEFVEDPFTYNPEQWKQVQTRAKAPLALDVQTEVDFSRPGFDVVVFKPSWDFVRLRELLASEKSVVVTHAMESAWGHYQSVAFALDLKYTIKARMLSCGLLREGLFNGETLKPLVGWSDREQGLQWLRSREEAIRDFQSISWEPLS